MDKINCRVPFGCFNISKKAKDSINTCLDLNMVTNGELVKLFEERFAKKFNMKYGIAVSSGTDADTIALASLYDYGAKRGDEVIIPASTFVATANAVINSGFIPVFVDVYQDTMNINTDLIPEAITERTVAIMPVHLMGKPANIDEVMGIATENHLHVIEDAAEAHGAKFNNQMVGTFGKASCFSLYAAHIISSIEGGMILTNEERIYNACKSLRNHGTQLHGNDWTFERIGFSSKMNELEASVGLGNLEHFDKIIEKRRHNFNFLKKRLDKFQDVLYTINEDSWESLSPHAYPLVVKTNKFTKKSLVEFLNSKGIDNRNLFFSIPTQTRCYQYLGHKLGEFPAAEFLSDNGTHIGIHQELNDEQLVYVADSIEEFINGKH